MKCAEHCNCTIGHWTYPWESQFTQNLLNITTNFLYSQFIHMQCINNSHRCLDHQTPTASCLDLGAGKGGPCGNLQASDHNALRRKWRVQNQETSVLQIWNKKYYQRHCLHNCQWLHWLLSLHCLHFLYSGIFAYIYCCAAMLRCLKRVGKLWLYRLPITS